MAVPSTVSPALTLGRLQRGTRRVMTSIGLIALFLAGWWVVAAVLASPYLPPPLTVLTHAWQLWSPATAEGRLNLVGELGPTLFRVVGGWAMSAIVAVVVGMAIGRIPWIAALLNPLIRFAMNLPAPALLPLVIVVFGFGLMGKFMLILFGVIWPILLNTMLGASEVDPVALRTARTLGLRRRTLLFRVLLPAAAPAIFSGLRIGLSLAIILTVIAEMYTATNGVGHAIVAAQRVFDINGMWAGIAVLAVVGVGLNAAFTALERRVLAWQHGLRRSAAQA